MTWLDRIGRGSIRWYLRAALFCATAILAAGQGAAQSFVSGRIGGAPASAERVAIVIGNQDYENVSDLGNARKDARDMAAMLREFRFHVFDGYDLGKREFEELLRTAMLNIPQGADVVFYYAGHGIQIGRRNYLLPVDAAFASIYDLPLETMTLDGVIDTLAARGSAHVAILDSCRNNPFPNIRLAADLDANLFETQSGFEVFKTPLNSLVAFSTSPGAIASDGETGGNSPYTQAVMETARAAPSDNIQELFPLVREKVHEITEGQQVPWESSTLVRPFFLTASAGQDVSLSMPGTSARKEDAATQVAQNDADLGQADADQTTQTADDTTAPPPEPVAVDLNLRYDREVALDDFLAARLGGPLADPVLLEPPQKGIVTLGDPATGAAIAYAPELADVRSTELDQMALEDGFVLQARDAQGTPRRLEIALNLVVDRCDLAAGDALDLDGVGIYRLPNELDIQSGLEACEAAVASDPQMARFHYQLGRLQQSAARFEEAYESFRTAEAAGHIRAKYALAVLLSTDQLDRDVYDIPEDQARALELLEEGVRERDPYSMHRLGKDLLRNGETEADRKRGFELLERSVELGHTFSMNELGLYFLRTGTDHYIPERGMRYLTASRLRQDIYGYNNLGFVALNGLDGRPEDFDAAYEYFRIAADGGHPNSPSMIARMILRGQHGDKDFAEAMRWYDMSLERGDGWGGANGAVVILNNDVPGMGAPDAALRAAKAVHLRNDEAAQSARQRLGSLPPDALNRALQMVLNDLGETVAVDGQIGNQTLAALERASAAYGVPYTASGDPLDRLLLGTKIYWAKNPVRFDLF